MLAVYSNFNKQDLKEKSNVLYFYKYRQIQNFNLLNFLKYKIKFAFQWSFKRRLYFESTQKRATAYKISGNIYIKAI